MSQDALVISIDLAERGSIGFVDVQQKIWRRRSSDFEGFYWLGFRGILYFLALGGGHCYRAFGLIVSCENEMVFVLGSGIKDLYLYIER